MIFSKIPNPPLNKFIICNKKDCAICIYVTLLQAFLRHLYVLGKANFNIIHISGLEIFQSTDDQLGKQPEYTVLIHTWNAFI